MKRRWYVEGGFITLEKPPVPGDKMVLTNILNGQGGLAEVSRVDAERFTFTVVWQGGEDKDAPHYWIRHTVH
jgi:hypothetical protein